jgi:NUMOD3 motif
MYYTYMWLREDRTPYYVGKGKEDRAFTGCSHNVKCPPRDRIVIYPASSEAEAFETEIALIWYYGRKDLGQGCLRNMTDGGDKPPSRKGIKLSLEQRAALRHPRGPHSEGSIEKMRKAKMGNTAFLGHKHPEEVKDKIRKTLEGHAVSEETKKRISDTKWQRRHIFIQ